MVLNGEQGSAKSTTARTMGALIDPCTSPLRSAPREVRDLMIAATNSWVLGFDNLSGVSDWLSDAMCRLSTGGGFSTRELYTDRDELIFDATRPLILGALLDAVSMALREIDRVRLPSLPRMADYALWVTAAEPALPWPSGSFMAAYTGNRQEAVELSLEADVVADAVRAHMAEREEWTGKPSELYEALEDHVPENTRKSKAWPKAPHWLSSRLKRATTFLRAVGIEIEFSKSGDRKITITRRVSENSVQSDQSAQAYDIPGASPDTVPINSVQPNEKSVQLDATQEIASPRKVDSHTGLGATDATDANLHTFMGDIQEIEL